MRSIGKARIKKLVKMIKDNPELSRDEIMIKVPDSWFNLWESAWAEINRIIWDNHGR